MRKKQHIEHATTEQIQAMRNRGELQSDWTAAASMSQAEVERLANEEDGPLPEGWEDTVELGVPEPAQPVHIRLDAEVLRWFKTGGPGYQTRINAVLRAFVQAKQRRQPPERFPGS